MSETTNGKEYTRYDIDTIRFAAKNFRRHLGKFANNNVKTFKVRFAAANYVKHFAMV